METEKRLHKTLITFTFHDNNNLGEYFVDALKNTYGNDNVCNIDQSTYIVENQTLNLKDVLEILHKAEEKGETHNEGDILHVIQVENHESLVFNSSLEFEQRLNNIYHCIK